MTILIRYTRRSRLILMKERLEDLFSYLICILIQSMKKECLLNVISQFAVEIMVQHKRNHSLVINSQDIGVTILVTFQFTLWIQCSSLLLKIKTRSKLTSSHGLATTLVITFGTILPQKLHKTQRQSPIFGNPK